VFDIPYPKIGSLMSTNVLTTNCSIGECIPDSAAKVKLGINKNEQL
jgi:hypothetical protein